MPNDLAFLLALIALAFIPLALRQLGIPNGGPREPCGRYFKRPGSLHGRYVPKAILATTLNEKFLVVEKVQ